MLEDNSQDYIVIVDDPVSSFDHRRRRATCKALVELTKRCSQLILLSHDAMFLRDFVDSVIKNKKDCLVLQLKRDQQHSIIDECNIYEMCQEEYYKVYERLSNYINGGRINDISKNNITFNNIAISNLSHNYSLFLGFRLEKTDY